MTGFHIILNTSTILFCIYNSNFPLPLIIATRCIDGILQDMKIGVKNWWALAKDREVWRNILREAETHGGLWSNTDDNDEDDDDSKINLRQPGISDENRENIF